MKHEHEWVPAIIFVGPEVDPVGADLKNLRHFLPLLPGKTAGSDVQWIPGTSGSGRSQQG